MQETWLRSLGREDPLEKEMANPLRYSCLENPMDRGAWWATVHGVAKKPSANAGDIRDVDSIRKIPWWRDWQTHSSILAWRIPWTEKPGSTVRGVAKSWT